MKWVIIQYSSTVYRDHGGYGFLALKYHPKTSLIFTLWHLGSIHRLGIAKLKNVFRSFLTHSYSTMLLHNIVHIITSLPSNKAWISLVLKKIWLSLRWMSVSNRIPSDLRFCCHQSPGSGEANHRDSHYHFDLLVGDQGKLERIGILQIDFL